MMPPAALPACPTGGRRTIPRRRKIPELLWHGAEAYGFRGSAWTCGRIAKVIQEEFGVSYDKSNVSRLLRQLRWTPQMPIRRASQRDEAAIDNWRSRSWPRLLTDPVRSAACFRF